ncbi:MAG: glutaredoxin family protein [Thermodesulfobacteriota bacterium]
MSKLLVEVYARTDCSACEGLNRLDAAACCEMCCDARKVINRVMSDIPFEMREVDICTSDDLFRRYREDIPTVFINGQKAFKFKVDEAEFRKRVKKELIKDGLKRIGTKKESQFL